MKHAEKYNKNKSTYFINPGNGEIIDKAFKNFIMKQQSLSQSKYDIEHGKSWNRELMFKSRHRSEHKFYRFSK